MADISTSDRGNLPAEAVRNRALQVLEAPTGVRPDELRPLLLDRLGQCGYVPSPAAEQAMLVAAAPESPERLQQAAGGPLFPTDQAEVKNEVEQFARGFFDLPPLERRQRFEALWDRTEGEPLARYRLKMLSPGLAVDRSGLLGLSDKETALADRLCELFVLPASRRRARRGEILEEIRGDEPAWRAAAERLDRRYPQVCRLDEPLSARAGGEKAAQAPAAPVPLAQLAAAAYPAGSAAAAQAAPPPGTSPPSGFPPSPYPTSAYAPSGFPPSAYPPTAYPSYGGPVNRPSSSGAGAAVVVAVVVIGLVILGVVIGVANRRPPYRPRPYVPPPTPTWPESESTPPEWSPYAEEGRIPDVSEPRTEEMPAVPEPWPEPETTEPATEEPRPEPAMEPETTEPPAWTPQPEGTPSWSGGDPRADGSGRDTMPSDPKAELPPSDAEPEPPPAPPVP